MSRSAYESRADRVLVGRLARGTRLNAALEKIAEEHEIQSAWISALGAFEWIDFVEYDQDRHEYGAPHRVERCELLSMVGNCSERNGGLWWHVHATVSHVGPERGKVYGGHVTQAQVFAMEYRIECFDGLALQREHDAATGLQLWPCDGDASGWGASVGRGDAAGGGATGRGTAADNPWTEAVEASQRVEEVRRVADVAPVQGDWIDHGKFGLCRVDLIQGDTMTIKLPDARRKKIKVSYMRFSGRRSDGDKTIYTAERR